MSSWGEERTQWSDREGSTAGEVAENRLSSAEAGGCWWRTRGESSLLVVWTQDTYFDRRFKLWIKTKEVLDAVLAEKKSGSSTLQPSWMDGWQWQRWCCWLEIGCCLFDTWNWTLRWKRLAFLHSLRRLTHELLLLQRSQVKSGEQAQSSAVAVKTVWALLWFHWREILFWPTWVWHVDLWVKDVLLEV